MRKKDLVIQVVLALLLLTIQYGWKGRGVRIKSEYYQEMIESSKKMKHLMEEIKEEKVRRGFPIDPSLDIHKTGMIGEEWSPITTTLGSLESKRTSTNPDFAALMVKLFKEGGLQKGDFVAANLSSSFPALNLAFLSAADTMGLKTVIVNSVGASTYGANLEDFTYLDMEEYLASKGLLQNRSKAYSLGGSKDMGEEFGKEVREKIKKRNQSYGLKFFENPDVSSNIQERYEYLTGEGNEIKAFVNIGGNLLSLGREQSILENDSVLLKKDSPIRDGLVGKFLKEGKPVYYFLNLKNICNRYGIPFDSSLENELGSSDLYYEDLPYLWDALIVVLVLGYFLYILLIKRRGYR